MFQLLIWWIVFFMNTFTCPVCWLTDSFKRNEGEMNHSSMGSTTCRQLIWSQIFHSRTFQSMEMADFSQVCSNFFLWHLSTTGESGPSLEDTFSFSRRLCRRFRSSSDLGNPLESWSPTTEIWRGKQAIPKGSCVGVGVRHLAKAWSQEWQVDCFTDVASIKLNKQPKGLPHLGLPHQPALHILKSY